MSKSGTPSRPIISVPVIDKTPRRNNRAMGARNLPAPSSPIPETQTRFKLVLGSITMSLSLPYPLIDWSLAMEAREHRKLGGSLWLFLPPSSLTFLSIVILSLTGSVPCRPENCPCMGMAQVGSARTRFMAGGRNSWCTGAGWYQLPSHPSRFKHTSIFLGSHLGSSTFHFSTLLLSWSCVSF